MMKKENKTSVMIVLALIMGIALIGVVNAIAVYSGGIVVDKVMTNVNITSNAKITIDYTFVNKGSQVEEVNLDFIGISGATIKSGSELFTGALKLNPGENKIISVEYTDIKATADKRISISPIVMINGNSPDARTGLQSYNVYFDNPNLVLVGDNSGLIEKSGKWSLIKGDEYIAGISFSWIDNGVKLKINRQVSSFSKVGDIINVLITVNNDGNNGIDGLVLRDSAFQAMFSPASEGFTFVDSFNDPYYSWEKNIGHIDAGNRAIVEYKLKVESSSMNSLKLGTLRAYVNGEMVSSTELPNLMPSAGTLGGGETGKINVSDKIDISRLPSELNKDVKASSESDLTETDLSNLAKFDKENKSAEKNKKIFYTFIAIILLLVVVSFFLIKWNMNKGVKNGEQN